MYAYANLYAAITPDIELSDITLTFVGSRHPYKLPEYLTVTRGYRVEESAPGIYHVTGDYLPIQIIESKKLSEEENLWLKSLTNDLETRNLSVILRQRENQSLDAYIDVIIRANPKAFKEVYKMNAPTLEELFMEVGLTPKLIERGKEQGIAQGRELGIVQGREQGIVQGREEVARNLLAMGMPVEEIARASELPVEKVRSLAPVN